MAVTTTDRVTAEDRRDDLATASPVPGLDMWQFVGLVALVTTAINSIGMRLLATINNIGSRPRSSGWSCSR